MKRLFTVLLLLIVGIVFAFFTNQNRQIEKTASKPWYKLSYVGSIGIGKDKVKPGIASFRKNYQKLDELSLYWYNLDSDNKISLDGSVSEETEKETITFAKQNGKKVLFGISDHGEAEKADDILTDEDKQNDHISNIISIIDDKIYDGVIIDYEDLRDEQEEDFTKYMRKLSEGIHSKGKILAVSVPVETKGKVTHGINIVDVSKVVDRMHMVTYEEYSKDTGPGPIASIDWVNTIIKNAIDQGVEPSKIVLGTAHSGHDWLMNPNEEFVKDMHTRETLSLLSKTKASVTWDKEKQANYFEYRDAEGRKHVVWLEDTQSIEAKINLAKAYQLQGIFIWYLGGEDPNIWQAL